MTWKLIKKRVNEGWLFQIGQHVEGMTGYWAVFTQNDPHPLCRCSECDEAPLTEWDGCGHATSIEGAVKMADCVARGKDVKIPDSSVFVEEA